MSDPAGQALMQALTGPDCPVTTISSGIYTELPRSNGDPALDKPQPG